nr:hypothetical protein [Limobrevibacterium gyesilva]
MAQPVQSREAPVIIAPTAPPTPQVEVIPAAPSQVVVWQPGRWGWNGSGWEWVPGAYVQRPQPAALWEPGHWDASPTGGYVWVAGHWR